MKVRIGWTQNGYVDAVSHSADVDGGEFRHLLSPRSFQRR
jgi:hypothetical protein